MIILSIRTDKPEAEVGIYDNDKQLAYRAWQAHLELSKTIHKEIEKILNMSSISWRDIEGIVCYEGPGSFTGLRIGLSVANALAYANQIPVVTTSGDNWIKTGNKKLQAGQNDHIVLPKYDRPAATTPPKK